MTASSLLLSWPHDAQLLQTRLQAARLIEQHYKNDVVINQGYASLLVLFKKAVHLDDAIHVLKTVLEKPVDTVAQAITRWRLPIFYDINSLDFKAVCKHAGYTSDQLIAAHTAPLYQVEFTGFLPGFPYLSGLNAALHIPRKSTPSLNVTAGSVAIAAGVCGIYPQDSPGGWYVLGNCPVPMFTVKSEQPQLLSSGDTVQFYAVTAAQFKNMHARTAQSINQFKNG